MRLVFPFLISLALSGCVGQGGRMGLGEVPSDGIGAMYTDISSEQIAACFAQTLGATMRSEGSRYLVASTRVPDTTYDIGPNSMGGDYPTEVIIRGRQNPTEQQRAGICLTRSAFGINAGIAY